MRRLAVAVVAATVASVGVAAAGASSGRSFTETAQLRGWTVTLTATVRHQTAFSPLTALRLRASVGGRTRLDRVLPLRGPCDRGGCVLIDETEPLHMLELADVGGGPTALVWLWTGGAHCCSILQAVPLHGGAVVQHDFGNHGAALVRIGGSRLFASSDDRFSYLFTSYAASGNPLQLWQLRRGRLVDVTASYPGRIAADAADLWATVRTLVRGKEEARGFFAAWAADACRLSGRRRVERAAAPLVAAGAFSPPRTDLFSGPTGARFPVALLRDLTRWGYCRPA